MPDPKDQTKPPDMSAVIDDPSRSSYANVLSEQAALILLSKKIHKKLKDLSVDVENKVYSNFSTDRASNYGHFHITNKMTKVKESQVLFHTIPVPVMSYLLPSVKLYKTIYNFGNKPSYTTKLTKNHKAYDWRIPFDNIPTKFADDSSEFVENSISEILQGRGRLHGVGIKSFNYEYVGTNPAEVNTNIKVTMELFFQSIEDLTREIPIKKNDPRLSETPTDDFIDNTFSYSDLVNQSSKFNQNKTTRELIPNEFYYRLKAIVGYAPIENENFDQLILDSYTEINELNLKPQEYIDYMKKSIRSTRVILFLTPYSHSVNFNDDGTLTLKIDYHATVDKVLNSEYADVLKISSAYKTYISYKEKYEELLNNREAKIGEIENNCALTAEQKSKQIKDIKDSKEAQEQVKKTEKGYQVAKNHLYSAIYQKLVGIDKVEGNDKSSIYKVEIKPEVIGINKEGSYWKFGKWDPEGKALEQSVISRLQSIGDGDVLGSVTRINIDELKKEEKEAAVLGKFASPTGNGLADNPQGTDPNAPEESGTPIPANTQIEDPELFNYLNGKNVIVIGDSSIFNKSPSGNNSLYDLLYNKLIANKTANIIPFKLNTDSLGEYFFEATPAVKGKLVGAYKRKADIIISFIPPADIARHNTNAGTVNYSSYIKYWFEDYIKFINELDNQTKTVRNSTYTGNVFTNHNYFRSNIYHIFPIKLKQDTKIPILEKSKTYEDPPVEQSTFYLSYNKRLDEFKTYFNIKMPEYNEAYYKTFRFLTFREGYTDDEIKIIDTFKELYPEVKDNLPGWWGTTFSFESTNLSVIKEQLTKLENKEIEKPNGLDTGDISSQVITPDDESHDINSYYPTQDQAGKIVDKIVASMKKRIEVRSIIDGGVAGSGRSLDPEISEAGEYEGLIAEQEQKFAKLNPESNYLRVKFILLGDMINCALDCLRLIYPRDVIPKIILGQIKIAVPNRFKGLDSKNAPQTLTTDETMNLADIPISLDYFQSFIINKLIKPQRQIYTALNFLKDVISDLIIPAISPSIYGEQAIINNQIRFSTFALTVPAKDDGNDVLFNMNPKDFGKSPMPIISQQAINNFEEYMQKINYSIIPKKTTDYLFIYCSSQTPTNITGDMIQDEKNNIFHFKIATDRGIIKKISFAAVQGGFYREAVAAQEGKQKSNLIKQVYNADISMFGNNLYRPGDFLYIEPVFAFSPSSGSAGGREIDISDKIGLGGYYQVINVKTDINENAFNTDLKCVFYARKNGTRVIGSGDDPCARPTVPQVSRPPPTATPDANSPAGSQVSRVPPVSTGPPVTPPGGGSPPPDKLYSGGR